VCGITGILASDPSGDAWHAPLGEMTAALVHRGPDDEGTWVDRAAGVALGHRRLSILDLSRAGHQPMASASGRFWISYNGELYNFRELRAELEGSGSRFRGHSDTEVWLAACDAWGVEEALRRAVGMFAFALWDSEERALWLVRDRLGEKPLYWGRCGGTLLFASELRSLRAHPLFDGEIDRGALCHLLRFNYIPAPRTIHAHVSKLAAGHWLRVEAGGGGMRSGRYWDPDDKALGERLELDTGEALERYEELLGRSLDQKMLADVPVGAFLSGGVDSTLAVAMLQRRLAQPVRTFTIGFESARHDEAPFARATAEHLGTDHTELTVTADEMLQVVPKLATLYDEPFADASQIPTFLVSRLARREVTVGISGDGGDELMAGYERYHSAPRRFERARRQPALLRRARLARERRRAQRVSKRRKSLERAATLEGLDDFRHYYRARMSDWFDPASVVLEGQDPPSPIERGEAPPPAGQRLDWMLATDLASYLPDDLMVKTDRAAMAVSLEVRTPFLDHRLVEFALALPGHFKLRDGRDKWATRALLDRYVPRELMERPKQGFNVPLTAWLRDDLRDWAEPLLAERRLREAAIFDPAPIRRRWEEHLAGREDWNYSLWSVLMFQAWSERWG